MTLTPGSHVFARTASGDEVLMRVVAEPEQGRNFPVVRLATEREFDQATSEGGEDYSIPWPLSAVREAGRPD